MNLDIVLKFVGFKTQGGQQDDAEGVDRLVVWLKRLNAWTATDMICLTGRNTRAGILRGPLQPATKNG